jgi:chemotaxis protein methyltransferase CheR
MGAAADLATGPARLTEREFKELRELILRETGICLKNSKQALVASRLGKRLRHYNFQTYGEYYRYLVQQPPGSNEHWELANCITTNKTDFFREPHHFDFLREQVLPELRERCAQGAPRQLRIWSAACSSGEEPYSIAITVLEALAASGTWDIKILASDIDTEVLQKAEQGIYDLDRLQSMPEGMIKRHFLNGKGESEGLAQVQDHLKSLIRFRRINFVDPNWAIRTQFDVIFCRNVIIYFDRDTQRRLFERLVRYLKPGGYLVVGHSENLFWLNDLLIPVRSTVYRAKREVAAL